MQNPILSVCIITYNQVNYITKTIESIINQQTNFNFEIIISNDASTDNSNDVIKLIFKNYKSKASKINIRYFNHKENLGMIPNFLFALNKCEGRYIALCEGDDYWIDPLKLQKQVDFLETHDDFSGVATNSEIMYENSNKPKQLFKKHGEVILSLNDLLGSRPFHTATFVFRKKAFQPDFPLNILSADRALYLLVASFGKIKLLSDVSAVYRKNEGGISRRVTSQQMKRDYNMIPFIKKYNQNFNVYKLKAFIAYTVLAYSHTIYLGDFMKGALKYLYYGYLSEKKTRTKSHYRHLIKRLKLVKHAMGKVRVL